MHIKDCIKKQENLGLAPGTVKTTLEILNPTFHEAVANRVIDFNPCYGISIKIPRTKKIVMHASDELSIIIKTIYEVFHNNPFYLSFYLFAIQGRRKSEILTLKWEQIDFKNNTYLLEDTKNGEHQVFHLAKNIRLELEKFQSKTGWVYESFVNQGQRVTNVEKQTNKLKQLIPNFTLHRLRNIIVSAMAEQGMSPTLMSAALGHNNTTTLSKYLTLNYMKSSEVVEQVIQNIINK
ncbi:MAG: tyrosine-type recombinase/integrase [Arcobacteraceae bacterium]